MKRLAIFIFIFLAGYIGGAQSVWPERSVESKLVMTNVVPEALLSSRSVVIYTPSFTGDDLAEIQKSFQQTGIDAVAYFEEARIFAGPDFTKSFSDYFNNRGIRFFVLLRKAATEVELIFTRTNGKKDLIDDGQTAWQVKEPSLTLALRTVYQLALSNQKKQNFLINDIPEREVTVKYFRGGRNEAFSYDVRTKKVAVPRWGNPEADQQLEQFLKANLPVKFEMVDATLEEKELLQQGFVVALRYVHTQGSSAKEFLGYDLSQLANALNSVAYENGQPQVKTIPAEKMIYKFYFKNLEEGSAYLGKQWDADIKWQDALRNHVEALKATLRLN